MKSGITLAAALVVAAVGWSSSSLADGALAVGMPENNPSRGFSHSKFVDEPDAETATSKAMQNCRATRNPKIGEACKLIGTFRDQCAAVAVNGDVANGTAPVIAAGWAIAPDSAAAASRAIAQCEIMRKGRQKTCAIEGRILCDGSAQ